MTGEHISLLINAGIAGVFAVFAIMMLQIFIKFLDSFNKGWQEFMAKERDSQARALNDVTAELKAIAQILIRHDKQAEDYIRSEEREKTRPRE